MKSFEERIEELRKTDPAMAAHIVQYYISGNRKRAIKYLAVLGF